MITFETITDKNIYIAKEMVLSNAEYNKMENGNKHRSDKEIQQEFSGTGDRKHLLIKADDTYIGLASYLPYNPKDGHPWLGLFMIHRDYQGFGYGTTAYFALEEKLAAEGLKTIRLGVLGNNERAKTFWERNGFRFYKIGEHEGKTLICFEKHLQ
ncbi:MAG: GNAT family N-acetyltransferase [Bacillus sp. (in: firmicutes)]